MSNRPLAGVPAAVLGTAAVLLPLSAVAAQEAQTSPSLRALRVEERSIRIDGRLDEELWGRIDPASGFTQREPADGEPASERTEVRIAYSDEALYVGIRAFDSRAGEIRAELTRRDRRSPSDELAVILDSYHDRRTAFEFAVTPAGSIRDVFHFDDRSWGDDSWDPVWEVKTSVDAEGWTAEMRIPLSQLRFSRDRSAWGLQIVRRISRASEESYWAPYSKSAAGYASLFGTLEGLQGLPRARRMEVRPYVVTGNRQRPPSTGSVYWPRSDNRFSAGADLKLGIGPALTLDATINPDFGQVEADPAVVNLTAYESFFPEKRPFFVEGSDLFSRGIPGALMFYSRRIGRSPRGWAPPPEGGTVEPPEASTILGAAKLTGKVGGDLGIGIMSAVTAEESARLRDAEGNLVGNAAVEPLTHHFAGRAQREMQGGAHTIGGMVTAVNRSLEGVAVALPSAAYVAEADGQHRWGKNTYALRWQLGASHVRGTREVITALQRSPLHYFQRPDAEHLGVDSTRTSLSGTMISLRAGKEAGRWQYGTGYDRVSPGSDVNDLGFQFAPADRQNVHGHIMFLQARPTWIFRSVRLRTDAFNGWTTTGEPVETWIRPLFVSATFRNNWSVVLNPMAFRWENSRDALRGGPSLQDDLWRNSFIEVSTDRQRPVGLRIWAFGGSKAGSPERWWGVDPQVDWRASAAVNGTFSVGYNRIRNPIQWIGHRYALESDHYLLAEVDRRTLHASARVNWTLTPRLSLEAFARPFIATGEYSAYKEVIDPQADEFADRFRLLDSAMSCGADRRCTIDLNGDGVSDTSVRQPDFKVRSLQSTAVLRWEYRPGSVLYVAWQHGRHGRGTEPGIDPAGDVSALFSLAPDDTLLVKASYWFGM